MPTYRTRLFDLDRDLADDLVANGQGWAIHQRHLSVQSSADSRAAPSPDPKSLHHMNAIRRGAPGADGTYINELAPELIITAKDFGQACKAMRLIVAGYALTDMRLLEDSSTPIPDDRNEWPRDIQYEMESSLQSGSATSGYFRAARVAAKASTKLIWRDSLAKYYHGFRFGGQHWMDLHPRYGEPSSVSDDPIEYTSFAQSIVTFFSVIEELDLHVKASINQPSKLQDGRWNPVVLSDLRSRLSNSGIDPNLQTVWLLRGTPTRIERTHRPPDGDRTVWAFGRIRDRYVPIYDAINYASLLRSRVGAHRTSQRTRSLTSAHVLNVQMLARELLMRALGESLA